MPPPRKQEQQPPSATSRAAAAGAAAGAAGAPAVATAGAGLAGVAAAGAITAAGAASILKALIAALDGFSGARFEDSLLFFAAAAHEKYPEMPEREVELLLDREREFETTFRSKMRDRLKAQIPAALAISDPAARLEAVMRILNREKQYTRQREEAMLNRAIARAEFNLLTESSPQGAFWKLSPHVKQHTLDCIAMGEKFWPWSVLKRIHPPLHAGCPCELWGLDEAIAEGLMTEDQVPDEKEAIARADKLIKEVKELQDHLGIEECELAVEELLRAGALEEARSTSQSGAMVALYPTPTTAKRLAQQDGEKPDDLHITLAFLGDAAGLKDHGKLKRVVEGFAAMAPVLEGEVSGVGLFTEGPKPVTYASADIPNLPHVRQRLVESLKAADYPPSEDHGFTPHMTLAYDDRLESVQKAMPDKTVPLRFTHITLALGGRYFSYPLAGVLEEARRGFYNPLRWAKGFIKGGEFRPQRGGASAKVVARKLLPSGPPAAPTRGRERGDGAWSWVRGLYRRIPEHEAWERRFGQAVYTSPPGTSQVFRDGRPTSSRAERRPPASPGAVASPDLRDRAETLRAERRQKAITKAERAAKTRQPGKPPISKGAGSEAVLALPHAGFSLRSALPSLHGTRMLFDHGDSVLEIEYDGGTVGRVVWTPTPPPAELHTATGRPPRSWHDHTSDALAWAEELGMRFDAAVEVPDIRADSALGDHAGIHQWSGEVDVGMETPIDIERAAQSRAEGRALTDDELRGVYSSYWVTAHEISHGVNPIDPFLFDGGHANLEEALAEECGHLLAVERLTEQGQLDVVEWRNTHPDALAVRGNYNLPRHALSVLFDEAGLTDQAERRDFILELKFQTDPAKRMERIAERLRAKRGGTLKEQAEYVEQSMLTPELKYLGKEKWEQRPEIAGDAGGMDPSKYRPALVFDSSPGLKQIGTHQYGRFEGTISADGRTLTMPSGHVRRLERLPLIMPGLKDKTDGSAIVAYPRDAEPTDDLTLADGSPKNFRYVDSDARGRLILRAFAGKGSPGTIPVIPDQDIKRAEEEIRAAKGLIHIEGVPVKARHDGSYGVGWFADGRVLGSAWDARAAARLALIRSQTSPPWGSPPGQQVYRASPGTLGQPEIDDFMEMPEPPHSPGSWLTKLATLFDGDAPEPQKPKKKAKPKPKPEFIGGDKDHKPAKGPIPSYDRTRLELGKSAGGSNGARWAFDEKGNRWLVKQYRGDQDRIATELFANALYREMGVTVAEAGTIDVKGKPALAYPTVDGEVKQHIFAKNGPSEELGKDFAVDALVGNWDYIGLADDNVLWSPEGEPIRVDQGGTFEFRAQGQEKPYGSIPTELWTMLSKGQAKRGAKVTEDQIREQAARIAKTLTPARVDELIDAAPFKDEEMRERLRENLKARIGWLDAFAKGEVELPKPLEGDEATASLHAKDKGFQIYPEELDSLYAFMEGMDSEINGHLRSKKKDGSKPVKKAIETLDGMFREVPTTDEDVIAYVGLDIAPGKDGDLDKIVGQTLEEKGYLRATLDPEQAEDYPTVLRLVVPAGSHALFTPALDLEDMPPEPQLVLARGSKIRIASRAGDDKVVYQATVTTSAPKKPWKPAKPKKPKVADEDWTPSWEKKESALWDDIEPPKSPGIRMSIRGGPPQSPGTEAASPRSGFPELDKAIDAFMEESEGLDAYRDPQNAWGACEEVANELAEFLKARDFKAYATADELTAFPGYENAMSSPDAGAGNFTYPEHAMVEVYDLMPGNVNNVTIDFTAAQYGFKEFPKIEPPAPPQSPGTTPKVSDLSPGDRIRWEAGDGLENETGTLVIEKVAGGKVYWKNKYGKVKGRPEAEIQDHLDTGYWKHIPYDPYRHESLKTHAESFANADDQEHWTAFMDTSSLKRLQARLHKSGVWEKEDKLSLKSPYVKKGEVADQARAMGHAIDSELEAREHDEAGAELEAVAAPPEPPKPKPPEPKVKPPKDVPEIPHFHTPNKAARKANIAAAEQLRALAKKGDLKGLAEYEVNPKAAKVLAYQKQLAKLLMGDTAAPPKPKGKKPKPKTPKPQPGAIGDAEAALKELGIAIEGSDGIPDAGWLEILASVRPEAEKLHKRWPGILDGVVLERKMPGPNAYGVYDLHSKTIRLRPGVSKTGQSVNKYGIPFSITDDLGGVFRHELGHFLDYRMDTIHRDALKQTDFRDDDDKPINTARWAKYHVSQYAGTMTSESIAEMFAMFTNPGYVAGTLPERVEAIMEALATQTDPPPPEKEVPADKLGDKDLGIKPKGAT